MLYKVRVQRVAYPDPKEYTVRAHNQHMAARIAKDMAAVDSSWIETASVFNVTKVEEVKNEQ
jgi:hypothetical protein